MHILIIPSFYPDKSHPTRGIFIRNQALAIKKAGNKVGVLVAPQMITMSDVFQFWGQLLNPHLDIYNDRGIKTYYPRHWSFYPSIFTKECFIRRSSNYFRNVLMEYINDVGRPDIFHAHNMMYGGIITSYMTKKFDIPFVLTEHSSAFLNGSINEWKVPYIKRTLRNADVVLPVSKALSNLLGTYQKPRIISVMGNIVNANLFNLPEEPNPMDPFVFSSIGYLIPRKRFDYLIKAFYNAFYRENVILNIAGDGPERNALEKLVHKLDLTSQVNFAGFLTPKEISLLIKNSHIVVSASQVETFGVTLIEAMACGRPVIATRSGGPEDYVTENNGILVPVANMHALSKAMRKIRRTWDQFDPESIRAQCISRFSEKAIVSRLENIYASLLK